MKMFKIMIIFFIIIISISLIPENDNNKLNELKIELSKNGIPENWINENISDDRFQIYYDIEKLYKKMPENMVKNNEKDFDWYKKKFGLDEKIILGNKFIKDNIDLLKRVESKNKIHYELITAIFGMETNYGDKKFLGKYYVFPSLVSHYLLFDDKKKFAVREITSLYNFCNKTNKSPYDYYGSFSGAAGYAQFLPSSLLYYFIDSNNNDSDIDIFSIEDSLFSIDNYLFQNHLNKKNIDLKNERYNAVLRYNHSKAYTDAVLYIYDELRKSRN